MATLVTVNIFVMLVIFAISYAVGYFQGRGFGRYEGTTSVLQMLEEKELLAVLKRMRE